MAGKVGVVVWQGLVVLLRCWGCPVPVKTLSALDGQRMRWRARCARRFKSSVSSCGWFVPVGLVTCCKRVVHVPSWKCAILSRHSFFDKLRTPGGRCRSMRGRRNQSFQARALCWALGAVRISSRDWVRIWRIRPLRNCGGDWKKIAFSCKVARRSRSSSEASAALVCCCCLSCVDCCGPCCKTAAADVCSSRSGSPGGAGVSATVRVVRVGLVVCGLSGWWPADSPALAAVEIARSVPLQLVCWNWLCRC